VVNVAPGTLLPVPHFSQFGIRFAYRRFGKAGGVPLVFNQHFTGMMDHWDPAVTDGFAKDREVILFNNAGVSSSSGEVPTTIEEMGSNAVAFVKALGLTTVDVFGFSIARAREHLNFYVAQPEFAPFVRDPGNVENGQQPKRLIYSGGFLSEDNDSGRQEKGTLSVTAESHG
jgi:hypothetical protein